MNMKYHGPLYAPGVKQRLARLSQAGRRRVLAYAREEANQMMTRDIVQTTVIDLSEDEGVCDGMRGAVLLKRKRYYLVTDRHLAECGFPKRGKTQPMSMRIAFFKFWEQTEHEMSYSRKDIHVQGTSTYQAFQIYKAGWQDRDKMDNEYGTH